MNRRVFFGAGFKVALNDMQKNHTVITSNEIVIRVTISVGMVRTAFHFHRKKCKNEDDVILFLGSVPDKFVPISLENTSCRLGILCNTVY